MLATLEDGTPALIVRRVEAGRVVVINGSADDCWCDLPRRKSFVPLVDRVLLHLQSAGIRRQFTSGEPMTVALPESLSNPKRQRGRALQTAGIPTDSESGEAPALADASGYLSPRVISPTGRTLSAQVTVRPHHVLDQLSLVVEEDGQEIQRRELTGLIAGQDQFAVITHRPKEAGLKRYRFQLMQGETPVDQAYAVNVQAVDDRHDVLILEDSWRWEFKYLRRVLEDDPSFSLTALLARGENAFVQFGEPERRVKLGGFPQSRRELDGFDTFVLGDVRPAAWPRGLARHIYGAVTEGANLWS